MFNPFRLFRFLSSGTIPESNALDEAIKDWDEKQHPRGQSDNKGQFKQKFENFVRPDTALAQSASIEDSNRRGYYKQSIKYAVDSKDKKLIEETRQRFAVNFRNWIQTYQHHGDILTPELRRMLQSGVPPMEISVSVPGKPIRMRFPHGNGQKGTGIVYGLLNHLVEGGTAYTGHFTIPELGQALDVLKKGRGVVPLEWEYKGIKQMRLTVTTIGQNGRKIIKWSFVVDPHGNVINIFTDRPAMRSYKDEKGNVKVAHTQDVLLSEIQRQLKTK